MSGNLELFAKKITVAMDRNHVSRPKTVKVAKQYGATDIIDYHNGDIADQILELTNHVGLDKVLIAGRDAEHTFEQAVRMSNIKIDGGVMQKRSTADGKISQSDYEWPSGSFIDDYAYVPWF
ncbi:hypothetical protein PO185_07790 [Limosilactobacillus mucosae]|nr:hypothetical protein [Limosilactobacillus mucosae]MDC2845540.1 hypothetical protein [Limosilactobacillus mucosae]